MSGQKILDGLRDAVAGNISRVTINGQTWVRVDHSIELRDWQDSSEAYRKDAERLRETLEWLNRKGGLGLDVHDRIRAALSTSNQTESKP